MKKGDIVFKTWAISDLHGRLDLWRLAQQYIDKDDTVYFLGDAIDRGPDGYQLMEELLNDDRIIYIRGNHEQMFYEAVMEDCRNMSPECEWIDTRKQDLHFLNGGYSTWESWELKGKPLSIIKLIKNMPLKTVYINTKNQRIHLTHAGFDIKNDSLDYLWDRDHIYNNWYKGYDNDFVIHGHTPIGFMTPHWNPKGGSYKYGLMDEIYHKIDIDNGAVFSNIAILINLDTFEEILVTCS